MHNPNRILIIHDILQVKIYSISEFDVDIDKELIFDYPFTIKINKSSQLEPQKAGYYMINKDFKDDFLQIATKYEKRSLGTFPLTNIPSEDNKKPTLLNWKIPPLKANKEYLFLIPTTLSKDHLYKLHSLILKLYFFSDKMEIINSEIENKSKLEEGYKSFFFKKPNESRRERKKAFRKI